MFKSIVFHERRSDFTRARFMQHWLNVHAPMSAGAQDLHGYVCGEVLAQIDITELPLCAFDAEIDGVAQMWFDHSDGLIDLPSQPSVKKWFADGPNFIGRRTRFMTEEKVVVPPLRTTGIDPKLLFLLTRTEDTDRSEFRARLEAVCQRMDQTVFAGLGLTVSHILSSPISNSVATFDVASVESVIEIWLQDESDADSATSQALSILIDERPAIGLAGARVFLTEDHVIHKPTN